MHGRNTVWQQAAGQDAALAITVKAYAGETLCQKRIRDVPRLRCGRIGLGLRKQVTGSVEQRRVRSSQLSVLFAKVNDIRNVMTTALQQLLKVHGGLLDNRAMQEDQAGNARGDRRDDQCNNRRTIKLARTRVNPF